MAGYYNGAFPIPDLMQLESFRELKYWYDKTTRETIEDNIMQERADKKKPPLTSQTLKRMVDKKLKEYKEVG